MPRQGLRGQCEETAVSESVRARYRQPLNEGEECANEPIGNLDNHPVDRNRKKEKRFNIGLHEVGEIHHPLGNFGHLIPPGSDREGASQIF